MSLSPLFDTNPVIAPHALAALAAPTVGLGQFALPKGTVTHRWIGRSGAVTGSATKAGWSGLSLAA